MTRLGCPVLALDAHHPSSRTSLPVRRIPGEYMAGCKKYVGDDLATTPLIAFINGKSGGHMGPKLLTVLSRSLGQSQVVRSRLSLFFLLLCFLKNGELERGEEGGLFGHAFAGAGEGTTKVGQPAAPGMHEPGCLPDAAGRGRCFGTGPWAATPEPIAAPAWPIPRLCPRRLPCKPPPNVRPSPHSTPFHSSPQFDLSVDRPAPVLKQLWANLQEREAEGDVLAGHIRRYLCWCACMGMHALGGWQPMGPDAVP